MVGFAVTDESRVLSTWAPGPPGVHQVETRLAVSVAALCGSGLECIKYTLVGKEAKQRGGNELHFVSALGVGIARLQASDRTLGILIKFQSSVSPAPMLSRTRRHFVVFETVNLFSGYLERI